MYTATYSQTLCVSRGQSDSYLNTLEKMNSKVKNTHMLISNYYENRFIKNDIEDLKRCYLL